MRAEDLATHIRTRQLGTLIAAMRSLLDARACITFLVEGWPQLLNALVRVCSAGLERNIVVKEHLLIHMHASIDVRVSVCKPVFVYVCMSICIYVCMYVL